MRLSRARWLAQLIIIPLSAVMAMALTGGAQARECIVAAQTPDELAGEPPLGLHDTPDVAAAHTAFHGQIVLGKDAPRFLYHLPIFMGDPWGHPHNFQVVLAVSPVDAADAAATGYAQDRVQHPDSLYTAVPPKFDQLKLVSAHPDDEPLRRFEGLALFRGHFEDPAERQLVANDAHLAIERVIYFNEFDPTAEPAPTLAYLLFGRGEEQFMVHLLSGPPDFDQILEVAVDSAGLTDEQFEQGVFVRFEGSSNTADDRLAAGEEVICSFADVATGDGPGVILQVINEHYCEVGELEHTVGELAGNNFGTPRACPPR